MRWEQVGGSFFFPRDSRTTCSEAPEGMSASMPDKTQFEQSRTVVCFQFEFVKHVRDSELEWHLKSGLQKRSMFEIDQDGDIRNQHRHDIYSFMDSFDGGSAILRFSSCTDMPSNSAALGSDTASSDKARKHKRSKRCGFSPGNRNGSS